jgi:H+-transporting ATPase
MAPPNGDIENGDVEKETRGLNQANDDGDVGEYGNLVRYISTYKDGRRGSTATSIAELEEAEKNRKWYHFGKGKAGASGAFETPDEWLSTDMRQGLSSHEVEQRRKRTGWNELATEKENMFLKFLSYFQGPVLYGQYLHWTAKINSIDASL